MSYPLVSRIRCSSAAAQYEVAAKRTTTDGRQKRIQQVRASDKVYPLVSRIRCSSAAAQYEVAAKRTTTDGRQKRIQQVRASDKVYPLVSRIRCSSAAAQYEVAAKRTTTDGRQKRIQQVRASDKVYPLVSRIRCSGSAVRPGITPSCNRASAGFSCQTPVSTGGSAPNRAELQRMEDRSGYSRCVRATRSIRWCQESVVVGLRSDLGSHRFATGLQPVFSCQTPVLTGGSAIMRSS
jgi:predicted lysophospholipase L1 biosynthesis ABC-type transport system permease subunit